LGEPRSAGEDLVRDLVGALNHREMTRRDLHEREVTALAVAEHDNRSPLVRGDHLDGVKRVLVDAEALRYLRALAEPNEIVAAKHQVPLMLGVAVMSRRSVGRAVDFRRGAQRGRTVWLGRGTVEPRWCGTVDLRRRSTVDPRWCCVAVRDRRDPIDRRSTIDLTGHALEPRLAGGLRPLYDDPMVDALQRGREFPPGSTRQLP
jgi:hypothetical protein